MEEEVEKPRRVYHRCGYCNKPIYEKDGRINFRGFKTSMHMDCADPATREMQWVVHFRELNGSLDIPEEWPEDLKNPPIRGNKIEDGVHILRDVEVGYPWYSFFSSGFVLGILFTIAIYFMV